MNLFVIRHATTGAEDQHITLGSIDWPLNEAGLKAASIAAKDFAQDHPNIDLIISSPQKRALQTAQIFAEQLNLQIKTDTLLRERNYGELEGLTWEGFMDKHPDLAKINTKDRQENLPSGESIDAVENRVKEFLNKIKNIKTKNVLIVTHTGIIRILRRELKGMGMKESRENDPRNLTLELFSTNE